MTEEKGIVKYQARDGQEVTLSFENVKRYLVSGGGSVTDQELMYFLGVCKSRGLNPFKKDAYLIKYGTNDPAAIVTSIDYFRSRARAQKDCVGWKKGIIVQRPDGSLRDSAGIILEGEKLIGGFFEAQPEGWKTPFRLEVNLKGFIKKTRDGKITRFWEEDNQPIMIAKVAEGQGLRTLWPDEFQGIYEEAEIKAPTIDMSKITNGSYEKSEKLDTSKFDELVNQNVVTGEDQRLISKFVKFSAKALGKTEDEVMILAADNFSDFMSQFKTWTEKNRSNEAKTDANGSEPVQETQPQAQGEWDPVTADFQQRYPGDKARILIEACKTAGIEYAGKTPREMHEALKKTPEKAINADASDHDDLPKMFDNMEPDEKLAACEKIHARIKTIAPAIIEQAATETAMTWDDVKDNPDMCDEFILYCLHCYRSAGKNVNALIPNGLK